MPFRAFPVRDVAANMQETAKQIRYNGNAKKQKSLSFLQLEKETKNCCLKQHFTAEKRKHFNFLIEKKRKFICVELLVIQEVKMSKKSC